MEIIAERDLAVLNEAKSLGIIEKPLPEDTETRHKLAEYIIKGARFARDKGERGDHVERILWIAEVEPFPGDRADIIAEKSSFDNDLNEQHYLDSIQAEVEDTLPIPPELPAEIPVVPEDFNDISDRELIHFIGLYNACAARSNWLYAIEEAGQNAAKQIADHLEEEYMVTADRKDFGGKAKTGALLKAEARQANEDITKWRNREVFHTRKANKYKRLTDHYTDTCDRLSRVWTVKSEERKHG